MKLLLVLCLSVFSVYSEALVSLKSDPVIGFTGYKFTKKVGVSGTFKNAEWSFQKTGETVEKLMSGATVRIDSYSIDAGKKSRNKNITNALFKNWGGRYIEGKVMSLNSKTKKAVVRMTIGKVVNKVVFSYEIKNKMITFKTSIDLIKLGFKGAFSLLSKKCAPYHIGEDRVTKTWSTVDVEIKANLL